MKKSESLKILLMLEIIEAKFNVGLNGRVVIKTQNDIIFLNFIIFQKLLRILCFLF